MTFIQLGNSKEEKEPLISEKKYDESFRKIIDFFSSSFNPVVRYMYMYVHS